MDRGTFLVLAATAYAAVAVGGWCVGGALRLRFGGPVPLVVGVLLALLDRSSPKDMDGCPVVSSLVGDIEVWFGLAGVAFAAIAIGVAVRRAGWAGAGIAVALLALTCVVVGFVFRPALCGY
jgi:hypothetical protein